MSSRHRLPGRGRIAAVRATGREGRCGAVRMQAAANHLPLSRVAFAVPRARGAVERNRVRRRLRAAVIPLLDARPGVDVVVSLPGPAGEMPFAELTRAVAVAFAAAAP